MAALPMAPFGGDDQSKQEYIAALNQVMTALQNRNQPNLFAIAGALLDPGRSGNIGEAVGRTATEIGRQQEQQEQLAPNIAMMKAQIAAQKYEMANQAEALKLMGSALNMSPQDVEQKLSQGNISMDEMRLLASIYPRLATLSPKVGEMIKNMFGMSEATGKVFESQRGAATEQAKAVTETPGVSALIPPQFRLVQPPAAAPAPAVTQPPAAAPAPSAAAPGRVPVGQQETISPTARALSDVRGQQVAQIGGPFVSSEGLPLKAQAEIERKRVEESDKPWVAKRAEIYANSPEVLDQSTTRLKALDTIASQNPEIFGLMKKQGLLTALAATAQKGINMQLGPYQGAIGADVQTFIQKVKLTPEQQELVADVSRILGAEFLANVKTNKGLLGVNPTDNDAKLLQSPMASLEDTARSVQRWSREQILYNKQRGALYGQLESHDGRVGATAPPRNFFTSNDYKKIIEDYGKFRQQLYEQFYPR
jgi:2C-methyl-D-erythritol 2,4-cyclodiphosphate synthase